ncbi:phenol 2-monooxygenase [Nakamurella sp. DB0629]|uniref:Phenol 2-monooxygenase n=2 Tax=Nakamurella aerolata TaxID=1656892 RepID=A0A849A9C5_9ACTN|nr:phenol 2-monooxygenase [Nakamurella aerolata]
MAADAGVGTATPARLPRVFIAGDACHTHSAKAGQGMNVSMQDGFNLGWKLGYVLTGRSPERLLHTYSAERQVIAQNLIDFDKQWSALMAKNPEDADDPTELGRFYVQTLEFLFGFMTEYQPSMLTGSKEHQQLAAGFTVGKRFTSAPVVRVADGNPVQLGHHQRADGRWRIYVFADAVPGGVAGAGAGSGAGADSAAAALAEWLATDPASPVRRHTPADADLDAVFDVKVVYPAGYDEVDIAAVPELFLPRVGPFGLIDYEKVYAVAAEHDIRELRGIDPAGTIVVVRPDQYVAQVLPLTARTELTEFFDQNLLPQNDSRPAPASPAAGAPSPV